MVQGSFTFKTRVGFSKTPLHVEGEFCNGELSLTLNGRRRTGLIVFGFMRGPVEAGQMKITDWVEEAPLLGRAKRSITDLRLDGPLPF